MAEPEPTAAPTMNIDLASLRTHFQDPYPNFRQARQMRLFKDPTGVWRAAHYEDVDLILKDRRFGKRAPPGTEHRLPPEQRLRADDNDVSILNIDPPDHTRLRGLMASAFNARRMAAMRPVVETLVNNILDAAVARGEMELVREFAYPIPATIISDMLGIPQADRERFGQLSDELIDATSGFDLQTDMAEKQRRNQAIKVEFDGYLEHLFADKREHPTDDLTSALIRAEDQDGRLNAHELTENIRLLFIAGHETTVNLIGNALVALHKHPDQLALLKSRPELMPDAVEEFLRFDSSVQQLPRIAQEDVNIAGQTIQAGEMVVCMLGAANRDEAVYADADTLNVERPFTRAKSFGGGIHFCLGAQLARLETEVALTALLARLPALEIVNLDAVEYPMNPFFRGPKALQARWPV